MDRLRWAGLAAIGVLWAGIGASVLRTGFPLTGDLPLSRLAELDQASALFGPTLAIGALLFLAFGADVVERYPVPLDFAVLFVAGMVGQLVAGIVPIGPTGSSDPVHVTAALVLGITIPIFLWRFAAAQPPGPWRRRAHALFAAQLAATLVGIGLSQRHVAPLAEIVPAVFFHLWVITVTLHRPPSPPPPALDLTAAPAAVRDPSSGTDARREPDRRRPAERWLRSAGGQSGGTGAGPGSVWTVPREPAAARGRSGDDDAPARQPGPPAPPRCTGRRNGLPPDPRTGCPARRAAPA